MGFFEDVYKQRVVEGKRYLVGRGSRDKAAQQVTIICDDPSGRFFGRPRHGGVDIELGSRGEQDATGESSELVFTPLNDNWEPIESFGDHSGDTDEVACATSRIRFIRDKYDTRRKEYYAATESSIDDLKTEAKVNLKRELTAQEQDWIESFVMIGDCSEEVEQLLFCIEAQPVDEPVLA